MIIKFFLYLLFALSVIQVKAQIYKRFELILTAALGNKRVSKDIVDRNFVEDGAIYIYGNREFFFHARNRGTVNLNLPEWRTDKAEIFNLKGYKIFLFADAQLLAGMSDNKVRIAIVLDRLIEKNKIVKLSFHTTDLNSKLRHRLNHTGKIFQQFKCQLLENSDSLVVTDVIIKNIKHRSIND